LSAEVYTDGSVLENRNAGFGVYIPSPEFHISIHTFNSGSIFCVEAMAIFRAVNTITEKNFTKTDIFTDSLSTISTL
ncbi:hypothetical protein EAI_01856, partial [Harpegnathos saltator]